MAKANDTSVFKLKNPISLHDFLFGARGDGNNNNVNFSIKALTAFFHTAFFEDNTAGIAPISFMYSDLIADGKFTSDGTDSLNEITRLVVSNKNNEGSDLDILFDFVKTRLKHFELSISIFNNPNIVSFYNINNIVVSDDEIKTYTFDLEVSNGIASDYDLVNDTLYGIAIKKKSGGILDSRYRVEDDDKRDLLILNDLIEVGDIIYHITDNKRYILDTYPTKKSLTGVVWSAEGDGLTSFSDLEGNEKYSSSTDKRSGYYDEATETYYPDITFEYQKYTNVIYGDEGALPPNEYSSTDPLNYIIQPKNGYHFYSGSGVGLGDAFTYIGLPTEGFRANPSGTFSFYLDFRKGYTGSVNNTATASLKITVLNIDSGGFRKTHVELLGASDDFDYDFTFGYNSNLEQYYIGMSDNLGTYGFAQIRLRDFIISATRNHNPLAIYNNLTIVPLADYYGTDALTVDETITVKKENHPISINDKNGSPQFQITDRLNFGAGFSFNQVTETVQNDASQTIYYNNIPNVFGQQNSLRVTKTGKQVTFNFASPRILQTVIDNWLIASDYITICTLPDELRHNMDQIFIRTMMISDQSLYVVEFNRISGEVNCYAGTAFLGDLDTDGVKFNIHLTYQVD